MKPISIWFLSDFGLADEWVAVCKAVIWQKAPEAQVYDITHLVPPYNVKTGAFILRNAALSIGAAVYLAVVDPGVGSQRRPLALSTNNGAVLIGPDNGLLLPATAALGGIKKAVWLTKQHYWRQPVCPTFHARDIFAPAAAAIATSTPLESLGETISVDSLTPSPWPRAIKKNNLFAAEIIHSDHFGTVRFNIAANEVKKAGLKVGQTISLTSHQLELSAVFVTTFTEVQPGKPLFLIDSAELLCLAVNQGSAARKFNLRIGQQVQLKW